MSLSPPPPLLPGKGVTLLPVVEKWLPLGLLGTLFSNQVLALSESKAGRAGWQQQCKRLSLAIAASLLSFFLPPPFPPPLSSPL